MIKMPLNGEKHIWTSKASGLTLVILKVKYRRIKFKSIVYCS